MARYNKNKHQGNLKGMRLLEGVKSYPAQQRKNVKQLNFNVLVDEMSKESHELFNDTFKRVSEETGSSIASVKKYWAELRREIPVILSNYPYLTREQREILITKSTAFERVQTEPSIKWTDEEILKLLKELVKIYDPSYTKKKIFDTLGEKLERKPKGVELLWYNRLRNSYMEFDLTNEEKETLQKFAGKNSIVKSQTIRQTLVDKSHLREINNKNNGEEKLESRNSPKYLKPSEFRSNRFRNYTLQDVNNEIEEVVIEKEVITPEEIATPEFLDYFGIKSSTIKVEEKQLKEEPYEDSEFILRKISDNEFEIVKGVLKINADIVSSLLKTNKTVVLDEKDNLVAKNYL